MVYRYIGLVPDAVRHIYGKNFEWLFGVVSLLPEKTAVGISPGGFCPLGSDLPVLA